MNSIVNVMLIVEGPTERNFIEQVLAPYMANKDIYLSAAVATKKGVKGGDIKFEKIQKDIRNFINQRGDTYVSLFIDYYGTQNSWPGFETANRNSIPTQISDHINHSTLEKLKVLYPQLDIERRFIPYFNIHEFETLLFSDSEKLSSHLQVERSEIENIIIECGSPEQINNSPQTAPSKRLEKLLPSYKKTVTGINIAKDIGIDKMRVKCPEFNKWVTVLEELVPLS